MAVYGRDPLLDGKKPRQEIHTYVSGYIHPKYREYGKKLFAGADERYTEYAKRLEPKLGIPCEKLTPLIFILIRACVHYTLFEDAFYLKS